MKSSRSISVVGCHAEGEVGDIILSGVRDVPAATMKEKYLYWRTHGEDLRHLVLNEPRGRLEMSAVLLLSPCNPAADFGFVIMASGDYSPMSGSNAMCATTVLLETGTMPMTEPITEITYDTAVGLVRARARCENGECKSVAIDTSPSFVYGLDLPIEVPGLGTINVDIAFGGRWFLFVDSTALSVDVSTASIEQLIGLAQRVKVAALEKHAPVHPESPEFSGIDNVGITEPLSTVNGQKITRQAVVIKPGRMDRSPCGNGTTARLAIFKARGLLKECETATFSSPIGTEFRGSIRGTTRVGDKEAVQPTIEGRAWITSYKQLVLDPSDPFPTGYRVR